MQPKSRSKVSGAAAALARADAFRDLPRTALAHLAQGAQRCSFEPGSVLMRQDDPSDCLHVIARGRVHVLRAIPELGAEPALLAELGPGDVVGEMGILDDAPRSATVTAVEPTDTLCISADLIGAVMLQYPRVSSALFQLMSGRMRGTKELTARLMQKSHSWLGPW